MPYAYDICICHMHMLYAYVICICYMRMRYAYGICIWHMHMVYDPSARPQRVTLWGSLAALLGSMGALGGSGGWKLLGNQKKLILYCKTQCFWKKGPFRCRVVKVTSTLYGNLQGLRAHARRGHSHKGIIAPLFSNTARTPQCKHCLGNDGPGGGRLQGSRKIIKFHQKINQVPK